ncbi:hypothetical protein ANN_02929 [Periplaneta americana]|uniref:Uncharacterized protein n=1 Tax=Periplaneta americana TaxID=6978 RepID=A0ABQ8TXN4_PERAM|nr:hypothetical protein ANN_02929 [Periplaneta americana]
MSGLCEGDNAGEKLQPDNLPQPGIEPWPPGFAARRANRYSTGVDERRDIKKRHVLLLQPHWNMRVNTYKAGLELTDAGVTCARLALEPRDGCGCQGGARSRFLSR